MQLEVAALIWTGDIMLGGWLVMLVLSIDREFVGVRHLGLTAKSRGLYVGEICGRNLHKNSHVDEAEDGGPGVSSLSQASRKRSMRKTPVFSLDATNGRASESTPHPARGQQRLTRATIADSV